MERLHRLLFELSSSERMAIVLELQRHRLRLSHISQKLDLTVTEASRHLQRLSDAMLIQKDAGGSYGLTPFGALALSLFSGLDFVSKHREYFEEYDTSSLPYEFIDRIGELAEGEVGTEIFRNLEETEKRFKEAQEFIWILSDQVLTLFVPVLVEKLKVPFDLRAIFTEAVTPQDDTAPIPSTTPSVQKRVLPKVDVAIVVTEKDAGFCLSNRSGRIDYRGFSGKDPKFHKWCKDLFLYYWDKAKPFVSK